MRVAIVFIFMYNYLRMISFDRIKRKSVITSNSACLWQTSQQLAVF